MRRRARGRARPARHAGFLAGRRSIHRFGNPFRERQRIHQRIRPADRRAGARLAAVPRAAAHAGAGPLLPYRARRSGPPRGRSACGVRDGRRRSRLDVHERRPVRRRRELPRVPAQGGRDRRSAASRDRRSGHGQGGRHLRADARRSRERRDRSRIRRVFAAAAEDLRGHGGVVPADAARVRRTRLSPLRMEVRQPERAVTRGGASLRLHVRGAVPAGGRLQGALARHRVVFDRRRRMAGAALGVRAVARGREFRRARPSAAVAVDVDRGGARALTRDARRGARPVKCPNPGGHARPPSDDNDIRRHFGHGFNAKRAARNGAGDDDRRRRHLGAPRSPAAHAQRLETRRAAESRLLLRALRSAVQRLRRARPREGRHPERDDARAVRHDGRRELHRRAVRGALHRHDRVRLSRRPLRPPRGVYVVAAVVHGRERRDGVPGYRRGPQFLALRRRAGARRRNGDDRHISLGVGPETDSRPRVRVRAGGRLRRGARGGAARVSAGAACAVRPRRLALGRADRRARRDLRLVDSPPVAGKPALARAAGPA
ncbi:hypothetical protein DP59_5885 [Burkholderia pseudomallei]|nr:hypothetical protein DP59_5885 [Burkholderia pseudomallei]